MYFHRTPGIIQRLFPSRIWRGSASNDKIIYLTFDDGPIPGLTPYILDVLEEFDARGTFFCVGENVLRNPDILNRTVEAGHTLGNHTYNHLSGYRTSGKHYLNNISQCEKAFEAAGVSQGTKWFRPPYGLMTPGQAGKVRASYKIVMWDVLSGDFDARLSPGNCLKGTIGATRPGSIVVFHDNYKAQKSIEYVLPRYLDHFKAQGYTFAAL